MMNSTSTEDKTKVKNESIDQIRSDLLRPMPRLSISLIATLLIIATVLSWSISSTEANPTRMVEGFPKLIDFVLRLMPPEFEFSEGSERALMLPSLQMRELGRTPKADRAKKATEASISEMTDDQQLFYVVDTASGVPLEVLTPEEAEAINPDEVKALRAYIVDTGYEIVLDDWDESVMIVEAGLNVVNAVPYGDGQTVVAKRYLLEEGEVLLGYPMIIGSIIETIQMALIGTIGAIVISIPFALLAARNISPHPIVYQVTRLFLNVLRSIPTLIWALVMVSAVGLGPFAGVMALIIGSLGSTAKLYAESFEQIDPDQVAAVRATGAGQMQVFNYAVLPQAFPLLATYSLISFEANVRDSSILGIVGAGGVGFIIQKYTALFQFQRLMGAVIILAIMVTIIDRFSDQIRKRII